MHLQDYLELSFQEIIDLEQKNIEELFSILLEKYKKYGSPHDITTLKKAYDLGKAVHINQKRETGAPYFTHPLIASLLLMSYKPDIDTLIAMLLHDTVEDGDDSIAIAKQITDVFGSGVLHLIDGVSKVAAMVPSEDKTTQTLEKLFAMAEQDVRILIVKLFDRLHNIITILGKKDGKKREKKIRETICIYVPLAERLGLWNIKKKLEDASTFAISPTDYEKGKSIIDFGKSLYNTVFFAFESLELSIPHSFKIQEYSISTILRKYQSDDYLQPEDSFFVQCEVETVEDIYLLSNEISQVFAKKNILTADFIATPKENGYQALHCVYIVHHAHPILVEFVTASMRHRNIFGIFVDIHASKYSLPLLNTTNVQGYVAASQDFLSFLSTEILPQKITIHGKDFGQKILPSHARVIDAIIAIYPVEFPFFLSANINGRPATLSTVLHQDDVLLVVFAEQKTIALHWKLYTTLFSSSQAIDAYFKNQSESIKLKEGLAMLQSFLDEFHKGDASDVLDRFPAIATTYKIHSLSQLLIQIYEGKILVSDIVLIIEKQKKGFFEKWMPWIRRPSDISARIQFVSTQKDPYECTKEISFLCKKNDIILHQITVKNTRSTIQGEAFFEASDQHLMLQFVDQLKNLPNFSFHIISSWFFLVKISLLFFFPVLVGFSIFSFLFSSYAQHYTELLSIAVFFIILANISTYWLVRRYFSFARYKKKVLSALIIINILSTGAFLYFFFQKGFDVFHTSFFLPLITLLLSIAMPMLVTKKTEESVLPSISTDEYKEKQRQKKIGYLLRTGSVVIWGLEPILIKYTLFNQIGTSSEKVYIYSLGVFIIALLFLCIIKVFTNPSKNSWDPKLPVNIYLIIITLGSYFWIYFSALSLIHTAGTNFILLSNFAPIFALLGAYIFWRSEIPYLQERKHAIFIFTIFLIGGIGSSFLFYNDFLKNNIVGVVGNFYAFITMVFDLFIVVSQIKYAKYLKQNQSLFINAYIFGSIILLLTPLHWDLLFHLPLSVLLCGIFVGILGGIGRILNYETFKRMDGFIAFLMFNIAILITFTIETFVIGSFSPSLWIILGGILIIGASIAAEMLNTHCERKQVSTS